ncbi:hypothetical protein EPA93_18715 [Ktedonosporobacter rubrisoli]|uniref:Uncharacterized protein n=1 Tax=Ktedonosporobacter rubrisoli TaxID=2509675 RepID=A0A4P6JR48_KTERU|nr:hypothetical protein [Ktedonosporobacter rubrisoli]QBD77917.1 hypothetical protein EPA93_18715 [Ktedonosporobacter rubrisoli]
MQYVPTQLSQELWNATPEHNWAAFFDRLQEHLEKNGGPQAVHPTFLLQSVRGLENAGTPYPSSPEDLNGLLNAQIEKIIG